MVYSNRSNSSRMLDPYVTVNFGESLLTKVNISANLKECSNDENTTITNISIS